MPTNRPTTIEIIATPEEMAALREALSISDLRRLRFEGKIVPEGKRDWALQSHLGVTVVQPCVVSGDPVTTRLEEKVERRYLADVPDLPTGDEIEMPEDDTIEPLPETLDLMGLVYEATAIAMPPYPRSADVEVEQSLFGPPGADPLSDEAIRPFAGLAELKAKMEQNDDD